MNQPTTRTLRALERAALLRADGHGWETVARKLKRKVETVRSWPRLYPDEWYAAYDAYDRPGDDLAAQEARECLRLLVRSEDEKVSQAAARCLQKERGRAAARPTAKPISDMHRLADYLGGLSHEEHRKLAAEQVARYLRRYPPEPGPTGGSGCT
jgi:hypothetical protein